MKDLYKPLGVEGDASAEEIRAALASPVPPAGSATFEAAEYVLLDERRRAAYDRTYRVLTTIGALRSHLGLNRKPFWARAKMREFTNELAPANPGRPRRGGQIRADDIRRAFGLRGWSTPADDAGERRCRLPLAIVLIIAGLAAIALFVHYAILR